MQLNPRLHSFLRENWMIVGGLALALLVAFWFLFNVVADMIYWNDPRHQDEALKPWMTPRYIVQSYDLPRPLVADALGLTDDQDRRKTMRDIAAENGITLDELTERVRAAAATHRADQQ